MPIWLIGSGPRSWAISTPRRVGSTRTAFIECCSRGKNLSPKLRLTHPKRPSTIIIFKNTIFSSPFRFLPLHKLIITCRCHTVLTSVLSSTQKNFHYLAPLFWDKKTFFLIDSARMCGTTQNINGEYFRVFSPSTRSSPNWTNKTVLVHVGVVGDKL